MAAALGTAYTLSGRVADAVALLTQATEQTIATEMTGFQVLCSLPLGEAQMLAGHLTEAYALTEQMLTLARRYQERGHQAYALHLLGEIAVQSEPSAHTSAEAYYRQAFALAEELGMRPLMAHCHLSLGTLYSRMGRVDQARAELSCGHRVLPLHGDDVLAVPRRGGASPGRESIRSRRENADRFVRTWRSHT